MTAWITIWLIGFALTLAWIASECDDSVKRFRTAVFLAALWWVIIAAVFGVLILQVVASIAEKLDGKHKAWWP